MISTFSHCVFNGPAVFVQAGANCSGTNPSFLRPLRDGLDRAGYVQQTIRRTVACLFFACGPSAIFRCVVAIVVDAFQCETRRALAHVNVEVGVVRPCSANRDASPAVPLVGVGSGLHTSSAHVAPDCPCACFRQSMLRVALVVRRQSIDLHRFARFFVAQASATFLNAQRRLPHDFFHPAVTAHLPALGIVFLVGQFGQQFDHGQPASAVSNRDAHAPSIATLERM